MTREAAEQAARLAIQNRALLSARSYPTYLLGQVTNAPIWIQWKRLLSRLRRLRTVAFVLRILTVALSILETGALVLLSGILLLALLPLLATLLIGYGVFVRIRAGRTTRQLRDAMGERPVYVLFPAVSEQGFFWQNARELTARGTVLLVSPHLFSPRLPFGKKHFFATACTVAPDMYAIRRYYLPLLRGHLPHNTAFLF